MNRPEMLTDQIANLSRDVDGFLVMSLLMERISCASIAAISNLPPAPSQQRWTEYSGYGRAIPILLSAARGRERGGDNLAANALLRPFITKA